MATAILYNFDSSSCISNFEPGFEVLVMGAWERGDENDWRLVFLGMIDMFLLGCMFFYDKDIVFNKALEFR